MKAAKNDLVATMQKLKTGLVTYCGNKTLILNGVSVKCDEVVQKLQSDLDLLTQVETTREAWQRAVASAKPIPQAVLATLTQVRAYAAAQFGVGSGAYVALGFPAPRPRQRTVATMAQAAEQARATRKARNTMGSKQKRAIRGVVPASAAKPVTNGNASPAATVAPSAVPSSGNGTPSH